MIRISKEFTFEAAHTLTGYEGACREIHGHSYRLTVTVAGEPCEDALSPSYGMVLDFKVLKELVERKILSRYDHSFIIRRTAGNARLREVLCEEFENIREVDFQPTCENLVAHFAELLKTELPTNVELYSIRLYETANSCAEWKI